MICGISQGIGFAVCENLLKNYSDTVVYLACRDVGRGQAAVQKLKENIHASIDDRVHVICIDTSSKQSVESAAASLSGVTTLYGIVNNAGTGNGQLLQDVMKVNYWGVRYVTDAFLPLLQKEGGRIVNVGSGAGPGFIAGAKENSAASAVAPLLAEPWKIESVQALDEIAKTYKADDEGPSSWETYGFTKAMLAAYTYLVAKANPSLVVNTVSPGFIATDLTAKLGASKPPSDGAIPIVYLLMDPDLAKKPQGRYYGSDTKRSPLAVTRDPGAPEYDGPDGP